MSIRMASMEARFLDEASAGKVRDTVSTPVYVYDESSLVAQADKALAFPNAYGLTVRYAMKACPNKHILKLFCDKGLNFDASSGFEVHRAMKAGIPAVRMSMSSQEMPRDFKALFEIGIAFNACSLSQLETFGQLFPGGACGLRFNPGVGSGGTAYKTNVGGPASSFGIWYELMPQVKAIVDQYNLQIVRIHTHIGSGSDPKVWQQVTGDSINLCREFPMVETLNLGGGYKVGRMPGEASTDLLSVGEPVVGEFERFAEETGRRLKLEIEPGTFLLANAGALLCEVRDIVTTGAEGFTFIKVDSGMTEVLRPSLYGAQHPMTILGDGTKEEDYVVVGHCCESGDLFSCKPGDSEAVDVRRLRRAAIGDLMVIDGSGAYCSSMSTKNYNSFPEAPEVLLRSNGDVQVIRTCQTLEQMLQNEV
jgi:diaminopimelate decarboxylase